MPSCLNEPFFQQVRAKISNLTKVPWEYAEHLQLLRYEPGQFYREHHDQVWLNATFAKRMCLCAFVTL